MGSGLPEEDRLLFQQAIQGARPMQVNRHPDAGLKPKPRPLPLQRLRDEHEALTQSRLSDMTPDSLLDSDEELSFARNGVSADTLKKLRRGHWSVAAELDLHGLRSDEARETFSEFIRRCHNRDLRCLRVIHGKGLGSVGRTPVLKQKVRAWLMQKEEVLAFCQATAPQGGAGAVLVLLKSAGGRRPAAGDEV
jgi:DNA-nicking Smr family endonuclease